MKTRVNMTDAEFEMAVAEIVDSGRGLEAIKIISQREIIRSELTRQMLATEDASLTAIRKIANSTQTASQKIRGIKALADMRGESND